MDYLFFDLECANGSAVCSFGYVLIDYNFTIKDKRDILINPESEFRLSGHNAEPRIHLAYSPKEFRRFPNFGKRYGEINRILNAEGRVLLGHAIAADIEFLDKACDRYGVPRPKLSVYDTQKIYAAFSCSAEVRKLEKIMEELELVSDSLSAHKSCDDAEMSMLAVKEMCRRENVTLSQFLEKRKNFIVDREAMDRAYRKRAVNKINKYLKFMNRENKEAKTVCYTGILDMPDSEKAKQLIEQVYATGFYFSINPEKSDLIADSEEQLIKLIGNKNN